MRAQSHSARERVNTVALLFGREGDLLADDGAEVVEDDGAQESAHVHADFAGGGVDQQDLAACDGLAQVEGGPGLADHVARGPGASEAPLMSR
jgi:hypothetical protein